MTTRRWMKSVLNAATDLRVAMPWERRQRGRLLARRKTLSAMAKLAGA